MLVLSRKAGERIVIQADPPIEITIVATEKRRVRVGIDAPPEVKVLRKELKLKKD